MRLNESRVSLLKDTKCCPSAQGVLRVHHLFCSTHHKPPQPQESSFRGILLRAKPFRCSTDKPGEDTTMSVSACHCCSGATCWRILLTGHVGSEDSLLSWQTSLFLHLLRWQSKAFARMQSFPCFRHIARWHHNTVGWLNGQTRNRPRVFWVSAKSPSNIYKSMQNGNTKKMQSYKKPYDAC